MRQHIVPAMSKVCFICSPQRSRRCGRPKERFPIHWLVCRQTFEMITNQRREVRPTGPLSRIGREDRDTKLHLLLTDFPSGHSAT